MPTYVVLIDWTDKGVAGFRETVNRYEAVKGEFEAKGVQFKDIYWTLGGDHDIMGIVEAPDGETLAAALLPVASQGYIRITTRRALSAEEMRRVIAKAG